MRNAVRLADIPPPEAGPPARTEYLWLALILALALALRLFGLNGPLWYDEIVTVTSHLRLPWSEMLQSYSLNHHYLFDFEAKLAISLFGEAPWAVRLPAMLFGVAGVAAIWVLARQVAGSTIALATALLVALSYHHIWFSQNARGYSELAFFSTLGMSLFLAGWARPRWSVWLTYGLVLALAVFTHLTGVFFFAAQGVVWLALVIGGGVSGRFDRHRLVQPLVGFALGGVLTLLLYAPLLPSLLSTVGGVSDTSAVDVMQEYQNPLWTIIEGIRTVLGQAGIVAGAVAIAGLAIIALGALTLHPRAPIFAPTIALHIVLTLILLMALGMRIWPRFFFTDIPFVLILIVAAAATVAGWLARLIDWPRFRPVLFGGAVLVMVALSAVLAARNYQAPKQDLAGAFALVEDQRRPGEQVIVAGVSGPVFRNYFHADWSLAADDRAYGDLAARAGPMVLVFAFPARTLRAFPHLAEDVPAMTLLRRFPGTLGDGAVLVYRRD